VLGTSKILSSNYFEIHNKLPTMDTTLCCRTLELFPPANYIFLPIIKFSLFFLPFSASSNHYSTLCFYESIYLASTCEWEHEVFVFLRLAYFTSHNIFQFHTQWCNEKILKIMNHKGNANQNQNDKPSHPLKWLSSRRQKIITNAVRDVEKGSSHTLLVRCNLA
jgi:hypothetical protein